MPWLSKLNHTLARLDRIETHRAPLKRYLLPAVSIGLAGSLLVNNQRRAIDTPSQKKALKRDALVITGAVAGLSGGLLFSRSKAGLMLMQWLAKALGRELEYEAIPLTQKAKQALFEKGKISLEALKAAGGHEHHHHEQALNAVSGLKQSKLGQSIANLLKTNSHDHGIPGFVMLESVAAGSILGGGLSGTLADKLNGEDVRTTGSIKLKEGIFQFLGNITLCTAAILAVGGVGKKLATTAMKNKTLQASVENKLFNRLKTLASAEKATAQHLPIASTEALEDVIISLKKGNISIPEANAALNHIAEDTLPHMANAPSLGVSLPQGLTPTSALSPKQFRTLGQEALGKAMLEGLAPFKAANSLSALADPQLATEVRQMAQQKFVRRAEMTGTILGIGTGVVGGAWVSNQVNDYLTQKLGLAQGHVKVNLFGTPDPGFMTDKLGNRGLHWWDAILHVDDWPSALYLAGVKSLESIIWVLYGISGYLTGSAGTDYSAPTLTQPDLKLYQNQPALNRKIQF